MKSHFLIFVLLLVSFSLLAQTPTISSLVATGANIRLYTATGGGEALASSTVLVNGTHYFVTQTISCTESATRLDVTANVTLWQIGNGL